jgi:hypothetical protein
VGGCGWLCVSRLESVWYTHGRICMSVVRLTRQNTDCTLENGYLCGISSCWDAHTHSHTHTLTHSHTHTHTHTILPVLRQYGVRYSVRLYGTVRLYSVEEYLYILGPYIR